MKKLLITLSAIAVTMLAFTATSDAGHTERYCCGYDSCGRPMYAYRYVPSISITYGRSYSQPSYRSYGSYGHSNRSYGYSSRSYGHSSRGYSGSYSRGYSSRSYCR